MLRSHFGVLEECVIEMSKSDSIDTKTGQAGLTGPSWGPRVLST